MVETPHQEGTEFARGRRGAPTHTGSRTARPAIRHLHVSAAAVKDRIGRLMRRLGAQRRADLPAQALRAGIG